MKGEANNPIPLFQKQMQTAIAFLPGPQSQIPGKRQPLFLYFSCASLQDKQTLKQLPRSHHLAHVWGQNHNRPEKMRLQACFSYLQDEMFPTILTACTFYPSLLHPAMPQMSFYGPQWLQAKCSRNLNNNYFITCCGYRSGVPALVGGVEKHRQKGG